MKVPTPIQLAKNVSLYVIPCNIFKTTSINIFIPCELNDNYTYQALIPPVLARGTRLLPDRKSIKRLMQELYGASFSSGVRKLGNKQIMCFDMSFVNDRYIDHSDDLFERSCDFLHEILFDPFMQNGVFRQDYVLQESFNLKQQILSIINDKAEYSAMRLNQVMNPGKSFTKCVYGNANELDNINEQKLFDVYKSVINTNPIDIFVVGDVCPDEIAKKISDKFNFVDRLSLEKYVPEVVIPSKVTNETEHMDVKQGKLNIGFRTNITASHAHYHKLVAFNEIFGGGLNSKLFMNVREKASLCYTVYSAVDKYNGQLFVYTGIDSANYQKAYDIIKEQLLAIINGDISDFEMSAAKKEYRTRLKAVNDSAAAMVNYCYGSIVSGNTASTDEFMELIDSVTKDDVIAIAKSLLEDTVFFLTGN